MNINKKNIIILLIVVAVILVGSFLGYKYFGGIKAEVENTTGGANTEISQESPIDEENNIEYDMPPIEIQVNEGSNDLGTLTVCLDKCGDGVCQDKENECQQESGGSNCTCPETKEDCPQDCN